MKWKEEREGRGREKDKMKGKCRYITNTMVVVIKS